MKFIFDFARKNEPLSDDTSKNSPCEFGNTHRSERASLLKVKTVHPE